MSPLTKRTFSRLVLTFMNDFVLTLLLGWFRATRIRCRGVGLRWIVASGERARAVRVVRPVRAPSGATPGRWGR